MDIVTQLHHQARQLGALDEARRLCNEAIDEWEACLRFAVELALLGVYGPVPAG